jgi:hypothetical protein
MIVDTKGTNDPYVEITYETKTSSSKKKENLINSVKKQIFLFVNFFL